MIRIFLCGEKQGDSIENIFTRLQKHYQDTFFIQTDDLSMFSDQYDILIFKNSFKYKKHKLEGSFLSIVDSQNKAAVSILRGNNLSAITCGMSFKDTLNISSLSLDKAVVSLQRSVTKIDGSVVDPRDINITLEQKTSVYPILVGTIVLLLSSIGTGNEYKF